MATARSTTNSDIHSQLNGYVTDYLTKHMYDANTSWPLRKTIRLPKQAELEAHYTHIRAQDEAIRNWAQQHHCETSEKTKVISNGIVRQTSQLIDSVTIPDLNTALNITTPQTRKLYQREHQRAHTITNQFNLDSNTSINIAKILKNHDDTDFNLVIQAAHYFANHNTENMTPRMVPIPGFSAKWLGKTTSNRCKAICKLLKREQLALNDRHGEIRLRLLDTQHHNQSNTAVLATISSLAHVLHGVPYGWIVFFNGMVRLSPDQVGSSDSRKPSRSGSPTSCLSYDQSSRCNA